MEILAFKRNTMKNTGTENVLENVFRVQNSAATMSQSDHWGHQMVGQMKTVVEMILILVEKNAG